MDLDRSRPTDTDDTALGCGFAAPFDGFVDFTPLIGFERWQAVHQAPQALWYFSDVLKHQGGNPPAPGTGPAYPSARLQAVKANARQFIANDLARLLPNFTNGDLVTHAAVPPAAFDQQYFRANIDPSELYVQSPPGSTAHRRLPWDTGYENLLIAGDWTYNGLNVGCVEAAVMSGRLASHGITRFPDTQDIIGYFRGPAPRRPAA
jgi:hypothetical protein